MTSNATVTSRHLDLHQEDRGDRWTITAFIDYQRQDRGVPKMLYL